MQPNHTNEYSPGSELPQLEEANGQDYGHEQLAATPEIRGKQPPVTSGASTSAPVVTVPITPLFNDAVVNPVASVTNASTARLTADDADLIEKEWVLKAKAIIMQTKDDPRAQNVQMSSIKADYLKKRYNKDLKINET